MPPFSYFRNQHRRTGSIGNSDPPHSPLWRGPHSPFAAGGDDSAKSPASFRPSAIPSPAAESPVSPSPPILPPIPRVASKQEKGRSAHTASKSDSGPPASNTTEVNLVQDSTQAETSRTKSSAPPLIPRIVTRWQSGYEPSKMSAPDSRPELGFGRNYQSTISAERVDTLQSSQQDTRSYSRLSEANQTHTSSPSLEPPHVANSSDLQLPLNTNSRRASSPASSFSSFQKSISSSSFAPEQLSTFPKSPQPTNPTLQPTNSIAQRPAKPKMNLLNPISLLRRRRTAQNVENVADNTIVTHHNLDVPAMSLPEDYDPRIKGKGVHDFSAPRPRRHHSTNDVDTSNLQALNDGSPEEENRPKSSMAPLSNSTDKGTGAEVAARKTPETEHVPIFHENFDDDMDAKASSSAVNRESLANSSFLARMSQRLDFEPPQQMVLQIDSGSDAQRRTQSPAGERTSKSTVGPPSIRASSDHSTARSSISNDTRATSPPGSPPSRNQRTSLNLEPPIQATSLKHLSSNASRTSRFSFQLNSEATLAQEKALEEKGKEKAAKAKQFDSESEGEFGSSSEDDVTNYGDMDDDPYEEDIPMVNVVDDDQLDEDGEDRSSPTNEAYNISSQDSQALLATQTGVRSESDELGNTLQSSYPKQGKLQHSGESIDSMYFDDGLIGDPSPDATGHFDESLLDSPVDANGDGTQSTEDFRSNDHNSNGTEISNHIPYYPGHLVGNTDLQSGMPLGISAGPFGFKTAHSSWPTQNGAVPLSGLEEYHNALASAATKAEADGRFRRNPSVDISASDIGADDGLKYMNPTTFEADPNDWTQTNFEDEDLDELDDDQMVAAANAEILASEDSEFYGREFGFYGISSNSAAEMYNGGFFGIGSDDVMRNASGMNAGREPNLTPITERSEFSTRNSFISLHAYGSNPSAPNSAIGRNDMSLPSPGLGLKELAASVNLDEDEITLSQLIKLRRETFGMGGGSGFGSPSNSLPNGSPLAGPSALGVQTVEEEEQDWFPNGSPSDGNGEGNGEGNTLLRHNLEQPGVTDEVSPISPAFGSSETTPRQIPPFNNYYKQSFSPTVTDEGESSTFTTPATAFTTSTYSPTSSFGHAATSPGSPLSMFDPSPAGRSAPASPIPMPMPSMMQKFATRPPASSASYAERQRERNSMGVATSREGGDSVAYIQEDDKWYLERRRRQSNGEMIVIGRELVEGGRI